MKAISHRANINGSSPAENHPEQILKAIEAGYDVEVDVRFLNNSWYLGHDNPDYKVTQNFIDEINEHTWFHCKNLYALKEFDREINKFFWHQNDDFSLTSNGYIWTYPKKDITNKSIIVDLYLLNTINVLPYAICTDYPSLLIK